jgi:hypothetical protein
MKTAKSGPHSLKVTQSDDGESGKFNVVEVLKVIDLRMCRENVLEVTMCINRKYESGAWRESYEGFTLNESGVRKLATLLNSHLEMKQWWPD